MGYFKRCLDVFCAYKEKTKAIRNKDGYGLDRIRWKSRKINLITYFFCVILLMNNLHKI